jgi:hypothetical protein
MSDAAVKSLYSVLFIARAFVARMPDVAVKPPFTGSDESPCARMDVSVYERL